MPATPHTLIVESQYFPIVNCIYAAANCSHIFLEQYENFQKMSYRNRAVVSGSNGLVTLTVPLAGGREQKTPIREVTIDHSLPWQKQHWRALVSSYNRAPFFEHYADGVHRLLHTPHRFLFDLNLDIMEWLTKVLKLPCKLELTQSFERVYQKEGVMDVRNRWVPRKRSDGPVAARERYPQVFEDRFGFIGHLSILDLLFCKGSL